MAQINWNIVNMYCLTIALILLFLNDVWGEMVLKKDESVTVQFDGNELYVRLQNADGIDDVVALCLGSISGAINNYCPSGYTVLLFAAGHTLKTFNFKITRDGITDLPFINFDGKLRFNNDDSLDVLLVDIPAKATLTLVNAVVNEKQQQKADVSKVTIGIIVGGIVFVLLGIFAIFLILFFIYRKKVTRVVIPAAVPQNPEPNQKTVVTTVEIPQKIEQTSAKLKTIQKQNSAVLATKGTSTSTTKASDEKIQPNVVVIPKVVTAPPRVSCSISKDSKTTSNETQLPASKSEVVKTPMPGTSLSTAKSTPQVTAKSLAPTVSIPMTNKTKSSRTTNLTVDTTQSPTHGTSSTDPTPEFSYGIVANQIADNSAYKFRAYLPSNEAPKPGSSRQQRSGRIVDEVVEFGRSLETYLCFAQREKMLTGHDHMMLTERIKVTKHHKVSDAERALLKAAPNNAPMLADILVQEIDVIIKNHCFEHDAYKLDMQQSPSFWSFINDYNTMASVGYVLMYRLLPSIYKVNEHSILDTRVRKMPLCGLYTLLLDRNFPQNFRIQLAFELRRRAANVIPRVQKAALRDTCFPATYLTLVYYKNKRSFVQGLEIHSKEHNKKQKP